MKLPQYIMKILQYINSDNADEIGSICTTLIQAKGSVCRLVICSKDLQWIKLTDPLIGLLRAKLALNVMIYCIRCNDLLH